VRKELCAEVNSTFYRLPDKRVFEEWSEQALRDFTYAVKASRFITHMKKLADTEEHVGRFLGNARGLKRKLMCFGIGVRLQERESWRRD
jgi:uncharacterized protein YecE (DUF72 family)